VKARDESQEVRRSRQLLKCILPFAARQEFENSGTITVRGQRGTTYRIAPNAQTEMIEPDGRRFGWACLQSTVPVPCYDRMIAEYLLLRNDESRYLTTANLFVCQHDHLGLVNLFLFAFDIALAVNLILQCLSNR
jgi:hypothetical protein